MKSLSDYMNNQQTEAFNLFGAFFAFSTAQFEEQKKPGVDYQLLGHGLVAPKGKGSQLMTALDLIHQKAVRQDLADNGIKAIVHRELANYECQITGDYSDVVDALEPYGITEQIIKAEYSEFYQHCIDNDYF